MTKESDSFDTADAQPAIRLVADRSDPRTFGTVELHGISEQELQQLRALSQPALRARFPVTVAPQPGRDARDIAPMLGTYQVEAQLLRFKPQFPFLPGQPYRARFGDLEVTLALPRPARPQTRLLHIYPSAEVLPENLLRLYLYFSAPMREGEALQHIRLLDPHDQPLSEVFLDTVSELWDEDGTRLTLLFDPGRVKTGLVAHEQLGRALRAGEHYRLVVDSAFPDAYGDPLAAPFAKPFHIAAPVRQALDANAFRLSCPTDCSRAPLVLHFGGPVDAVQALLFVRVCGPDGPVLGEAFVAQQETEWHFVPTQAWCPGSYTVQVDERLEDCAGNNLYSPFDAPPSERRPRSIVTLPFRVADFAASG